MPVTPNNNLVTIHTFKDQEYLVRLDQSSNRIELKISDKQIGEEWQCNYDQTYIENLTTKTGNFKSFQVFTKMLNNGLLKSSRTITLSLLTHEELNNFQTAQIKSYFRNTDNSADDNKRYLIIEYTTEFDKIYYPLTLEYCGSPDVKSLIATIRRLEADLTKTREEYASYKVHTNHHSNKHRNDDDLNKRIKELTMENVKLTGQVRQKSTTKIATKAELTKASSLENALLKLEKSVITERNNHQKYVNKLQQEKKKMQQEIDKLRRSECALKQQLLQSKKSSGISSLSERQSRLSSVARIPIHLASVSNQRNKVISRTPSRCSRTSSGCDSVKSLSSNCANGRASRLKAIHYSSSRTTQSEASSIGKSEKIKLKLKSSQQDYKTLEHRINGLQKMLLSNSK